MPKLGQYQFLLDIVFFLYRSEEDAKLGRNVGGSGFLVAIPSATYPSQHRHIYAVTNWHVAVRDGCSVIRVNKRSGSPEVFSSEPCEWRFIPGKHDVAVRPFPEAALHLRIEALASRFFLTSEDIQKHEINAADDVFMIGRFIDYDGRNTVSPSMRFGHVSMMEAFVPQKTGYRGSSIVVDMHSRTGYSGSPVFVYRTPGSMFSKGNVLISGGHLMKLLGILWAQFPEDWPIQDKQVHVENVETVTVAGNSVRGWSGMSLVAPASAIWDALHTSQLVADRAGIDTSLHNLYGSTPLEQSSPKD